MDQTQHPRGDFAAFLNRDKQPGDNKPIFDGRIAKPGTEDEQRVALWAFEYTDKKTGEVRTGFNGTAGAIVTTAAPMDQIASLLKQAPAADVIEMPGNLKLAPRQVVLFANPSKDDAPEKKRPDFYGYFNPGDGSPVVSISAWMGKDRYDHAKLSGATQYPTPGKSVAEQQAAAPELAELVASGQVSKGMPKAKGGRGGRE